MRFKSEILQTFQGDIKEFFDCEFIFFKSIYEVLVVKSNVTLNGQI